MGAKRPEVGRHDNSMGRKKDKHPLGGRRGIGVKPSHQWGPPSAGLGGGCCGVHVAEESLNLPQRDTPTSVTHFDRQIFFAQGHHDLDRWENEAGFMAFHSCSHGILWKEKGKSE